MQLIKRKAPQIDRRAVAAFLPLRQPSSPSRPASLWCAACAACGRPSPCRSPHAGEPLPQHAALLTALPPEGLFLRNLLCGGFLAHDLGTLAVVARCFGGRRSAGLRGQPAGLSLCESAARVRFAALAVPGCPPTAEFPLCRSVGRALLSRTFATPGLKIEGGTLRGWATRGARLVIPHGVTAIGKEAFRNCDTITSILIPVRESKKAHQMLRNLA